MESEDGFLELVLSFRRVGSEWSSGSVVRLGSGCLYPFSHLAGLSSHFVGKTTEA